jgi:hypothetical protein
LKAKHFDDAFDRGNDLSDWLELDGAKRPLREQKRVNVDFPVRMIESLDCEARRLGVTRQSVIKVWLTERLEDVTRRRAEPALRPTSKDRE